MSLTRTTVYIDSESLKKLKKKLIDVDKSMSQLFREWLDKHILDLETLTIKTVDVTVDTDNPKVVMPKIAPENRLKSEEQVKSTRLYGNAYDIATKVKKSKTCPHFIMVGGVCNSCSNGIAI